MAVVTSTTRQRNEIHWTQSLTNAERKYDTTQSECLTIAWGIYLSWSYPERTRFTICKSHGAFEWILNHTDSTGRLSRLRWKIFAFDFDVICLAGTENQAAHELSCLRTLGEDKTTVKNDILMFEMNSSDYYEKTVYIFIAESYDVIPHSMTVVPSVRLPPAENKFIVEQAVDPYCEAASIQVGHPNSEFHSDYRTAGSSYVSQPSKTPFKSWYLPCRINVSYTWHITLRPPDTQVSVNCTIRFGARCSGHIWKTMYMKRLPSAFAAWKTKADLDTKKFLGLPHPRITWLRCSRYPRTTTKKQHKECSMLSFSQTGSLNMR